MGLRAFFAELFSVDNARSSTSGIGAIFDDEPALRLKSLRQDSSSTLGLKPIDSMTTAEIIEEITDRQSHLPEHLRWEPGSDSDQPLGEYLRIKREIDENPMTAQDLPVWGSVQLAEPEDELFPTGDD